MTFDPGCLTSAQRHGDACVVCHKKWPRPRIHVGALPSGQTVFACEDCAPALRIPAARNPASPVPSAHR
jgi:hypothetical protein